jgi:hypothetical protein
MAIVDKQTLKSYFEAFKKPTQGQFANMVDSLTSPGEVDEKIAQAIEAIPTPEPGESYDFVVDEVVSVPLPFLIFDKIAEPDDVDFTQPLTDVFSFPFKGLKQVSEFELEGNNIVRKVYNGIFDLKEIYDIENQFPFPLIIETLEVYEEEVILEMDVKVIDLDSSQVYYYNSASTVHDIKACRFTDLSIGNIEFGGQVDFDGNYTPYTPNAGEEYLMREEVIGIQNMAIDAFNLNEGSSTYTVALELDVLIFNGDPTEDYSEDISLTNSVGSVDFTASKIADGRYKIEIDVASLNTDASNALALSIDGLQIVFQAYVDSEGDFGGLFAIAFGIDWSASKSIDTLRFISESTDFGIIQTGYFASAVTENSKCSLATGGETIKECKIGNIIGDMIPIPNRTVSNLGSYSYNCELVIPTTSFGLIYMIFSISKQFIKIEN